MAKQQAGDRAVKSMRAQIGDGEPVKLTSLCKTAPANAKPVPIMWQMAQAFEQGISPTPHYCEVRGRAAEIARALGSPVGGPEHLFRGMLHDGGWPVTLVSAHVDLRQVEAAVMASINDPGYSPPPLPRTVLRDHYVRPWGAEVAFEMGDSYLGLEHALLAMIRMRDGISARALAGLTDLDALEAAVIEAKNAPPSAPADNAVFLPDGHDLDSPLRRAIADALPDGTTFAFNTGADERTWMHVISHGELSDPALTRQVLNTALASLKRPTLDG